MRIERQDERTSLAVCSLLVNWRLARATARGKGIYREQWGSSVTAPVTVRLLSQSSLGLNLAVQGTNYVK